MKTHSTTNYFGNRAPHRIYRLVQALRDMLDRLKADAAIGTPTPAL